MQPHAPSNVAGPAHDQLTDAQVVKLHNCPECGYLLHGLPRAGRCPECGTDYDSDQMVILYGWAGPDRAHIFNARPGRSFSLAALFAGPPLSIALLFLSTGRRTEGLAGLAVVAIILSVQLWMRWNHTLPGREQLRLTSNGFAQRSGFGRVAYTPWVPRHNVTLERNDSGQWRLRIRHRGFAISDQRVDLEFRADDETANLLLDRIRQWRPVQLVSSSPAA